MRTIWATPCGDGYSGKDERAIPGMDLRELEMVLKR